MNNIAEQNVSGLRAVHKNPPCPVSPPLRVSVSPPLRVPTPLAFRVPLHRPVVPMRNVDLLMVRIVSPTGCMPGFSS